MFKKIVLTHCLLLLTVSIGWGDLQIEVLDFQTGKVRLIYNLDDTMAGNKQFRFPGEGFLHDESQGDFVVESVFDVSNNYELQYSVQKIGESQAPQLVINYPEAIPSGGKKSLKIQVLLYLPVQNVYYENNRYYIDYETSHKFIYQLPVNHYLIYTNQPVEIHEQAGTIFAKQSSDKLRKIKIGTRIMESRPSPIFGN